MNGKIRSLFFICLGLLFGMSGMYVYKNFIDKSANSAVNNRSQYHAPDESSDGTPKPEYSGRQSIYQLTEEKTVINYVKQNHKLPDYYITKNEARKHGWTASKGNLCEVLPGKAIGGDKFTNREGTLPKNDKYFEADVNYNCGRRNADRIIFTKNGDVYLTKNHYKSFEKQ
ncbi:ribonuclease domain-containing protein [Chryseobacterium daeguense]|uniref:ribonuclease domain-containing protein n=1 Tax=Chryseobacterium daeguense TaxID=412438 RepID=UPI0003FDF1CE|nr:ribonuclease domain-containing protein [Chryseobacterium daeguense]